MYAEGEDVFYYLTLYNENYAMPPMPEGVEEGILKGLYRFRSGRPEAEATRRTSSAAARSCARPAGAGDPRGRNTACRPTSGAPPATSCSAAMR